METSTSHNVHVYIYVPFRDTSFEVWEQSHWLTDPVHCRLHTSLEDAGGEGRKEGGKRVGRKGKGREGREGGN